MMKNTPIVSIIIITWNSGKKLSGCLNYISKQNFPKNKIELIIVDGGSWDNTFEVVKSVKVIFPHIRLFKINIKDPEPKRAFGIFKAQGKYICSVDPDVYLTDTNWLKKMLLPLEADSTLSGSQTLHYQYYRDESLVNRYFALFGVNDPVVFYLKKADRMPYYEDKWLFNRNYKDKGDYFEVTFDKDIPTMGCNGVVFRKSHYLKAKITEAAFFHIDVIQDMVDLGYRKYAIVKNSVLHSTGSTFAKSILKRIDYMNIHYYGKQQERRYLVYDPESVQDKKNIAKFIFYTLTVVQPLFLSIKGFLKIPDIAWFLHWPMCFGFLCAYSIATLKKYLNNFEWFVIG